MDDPEGADLQRADRVDFDRRVRLKFNGTQLSSDGGLLVMHEAAPCATETSIVPMAGRRFWIQ